MVVVACGRQVVSRCEVECCCQVMRRCRCRCSPCRVVVVVGRFLVS